VGLAALCYMQSRRRGALKQYIHGTWGVRYCWSNTLLLKGDEQDGWGFEGGGLVA
jgi:hypothetical protein